MIIAIILTIVLFRILIFWVKKSIIKSKNILILIWSDMFINNELLLKNTKKIIDD